MAAEFDGSTSYFLSSSPLRGVSDSQAGTLSAWVLLDAAVDSTQVYVFSCNSDRFSLQRNASNKCLL
jgi:hypothetical protein